MLRVRKTSTRGIVREFRFRYKFKRRTGVITLATSRDCPLADARARAQRFRDLLQEGIDPRSAMNTARGRGLPSRCLPPGNSHNVTALIKDFTERSLAQAPQAPGVRGTNPSERARRLGAPRCAHNQAREVIELLDAIVDRPCPGHGHRVAGLLSQLFRYGIHRQLSNPRRCSCSFARGGTERPRQRALDDEDLARPSSPTSMGFTKRAKRTGIAIRLILPDRCQAIGTHWCPLVRVVDLRSRRRSGKIPAERTKTGVKTRCRLPCRPADTHRRWNNSTA